MSQLYVRVPRVRRCVILMRGKRPRIRRLHTYIFLDPIFGLLLVTIQEKILYLQNIFKNVFDYKCSTWYEILSLSGTK
jgi:hypothetical protein